MALSPVVYELTRGEALPALVDTATADSDGYYYRSGDVVSLTGNMKVGLVTTSSVPFGILTSSLDNGIARGVPHTIDARDTVSVQPFIFTKGVMKFTAAAQLTFGTKVTRDSSTAGRVKTAGESDTVIGIVWVGATQAGQTVDVLI